MVPLDGQSSVAQQSWSLPLVEVRQNITQQWRQDRTDQLLLVAAAGGSMLFTALLLRLVLQRGLMVPLPHCANNSTGWRRIR